MSMVRQLDSFNVKSCWTDPECAETCRPVRLRTLSGPAYRLVCDELEFTNSRCVSSSSSSSFIALLNAIHRSLCTDGLIDEQIQQGWFKYSTNSCPPPPLPHTYRLVLKHLHYINKNIQGNNTIRDAILTCAQKLTRVSLIYRTEPTTKKWKQRNTKE